MINATFIISVHGNQIDNQISTKVYNEERLVHRANGTELTLKNVQPVDKGEYACQVTNIRYINSSCHISKRDEYY